MKQQLSECKFPKLRSNIVFNKLNENEYIVCNSDFQHYLKINRKTYSILKLMDGNNSIDDICVTFNKIEDVPITADTISSLITGKLYGYGIFDNVLENIKEYKKPSYLKLSFIIIPAFFLSKIVPYLKFLFQKAIAIPTVLLALILVFIVFTFHLDLYYSFSIQDSIIYFFLVMAISVTIHEIGHATAAHFFGAKHGGIGGGFYLFSPVYYADVTDIWRLNQRQRIIVNFAGIYFELIFCSILIIFSFVLSSSLLRITSIVVFFHTVFNLNPFFRSDGYWILSDLLNKPNLFLHAIRNVKHFFSFSKWKHILKKWKGSDYILFVYGLSSLSLMIWFIYYVLFINSNSVLMFHKNLSNFLVGIFDKSNNISLFEFGQLLIPLIFYLLVFRLVKSLIIKAKKKFIRQ